jgi:hypothetical protein
VPVRIYLDVVEPDLDHDSVIAAAKPGYPVLNGAEHQHLACGACRGILAWNISAQTVREMFIVVHRLFLKCHCGAHNLVPGHAPPRRQRAGASR